MSGSTSTTAAAAGAEDAAETEPRATKRGVRSWMFFDWAQQPFHTLIITFVFAPYFASAVASDPARGQELWGYAAGIGGLSIALTSPVLGAIADTTGPRKPWIFGFSVLGASSLAGARATGSSAAVTATGSLATASLCEVSSCDPSADSAALASSPSSRRLRLPPRLPRRRFLPWASSNPRRWLHCLRDVCCWSRLPGLQ